MSESFAAWACHSQRTLEERFGAQLLIEKTIDTWRYKHKLKVRHNHEAHRLRRKERALNPAYEPDFSRTDAERAEEVLPQITTLYLWDSDDRPLRNIAFLHFCPAIQSLHISNSQIKDLSPLQRVTGLRELSFSDDAANDLRPLAALVQLKKLTIRATMPWPNLSGFEALTQLEQFDFHGNPLATTVIPILPAVRVASFQFGFRFNLPLRRIADLPQMPQLRRLHVQSTCALDGIERYPWLLNLSVYGYFEDLTPVPHCRQLTHLLLGSDHCQSLAPLAQLPDLRRVTLRSERPHDCTPLAEAPRLHEIAIENCPVQLAEVGAINAVLPSWSEEFAVEPRPLQPLRLILRNEKTKEEPDPAFAPRDWGDNKDMAVSEAHWFARELNRRLTVLLGKGWGELPIFPHDTPGHDHLTISRHEDIDRLPAVVQTVRELVAITRYPWRLLFSVDSLAQYERDLWEIGDDETFDSERERADWEYRKRLQRERKEYLEREYRYRLQKEQGLPTRPEDFAPAEPVEPREDGPGIDIGTRDESEYDLGIELSFVGTLTESALYIHESSRGLAEMLLETKAEDDETAS